MPVVILLNKKHPTYKDWEKTYILYDDFTLKRTVVKYDVSLGVPTDESELSSFLDSLVKSNKVPRDGGSTGKYDYHDEEWCSKALIDVFVEKGLRQEIEVDKIKYRFLHVGIAVKKSLEDSNIELKYSNSPEPGCEPYGANTVVLNFHLHPGKSVGAAKAQMGKHIASFAAQISEAIRFFEGVKLTNSRSGHDPGHGFRPRKCDLGNRDACFAKYKIK